VLWQPGTDHAGIATQMVVERQLAEAGGNQGRRELGREAFVANPADGSRHNRGCAVDLTLYDRKTGKAVPMVGGYDEMSDRSYPDYVGGTSLERWHRDVLRRAMEATGYTVFPTEWWHFDHPDWRKYPLGNHPFETLPPPK
jgi:D-alanyl-D-alanine dipeptidase